MFLLETLKKSVFPYFFQHLEVALSPWIMAPSSNPIAPTSASVVTSRFLTFLSPSFSYKDLHDYIGLTQVTHDYLSISRFLT